MSMKHSPILSIILTTTMFLAACAPAAASTTASAVPAQPTLVPSTTATVQPATVSVANTAALATAAVLPANSSIKVGLVTDTGGVNDHAFNQLAWGGVQKASQEMGFQSKFIESKQPSDYETNIDMLATEGYAIIITVGSQMSDATALKARQYPNIKFAIIDNAYVPADRSQACAGTVTDCYADGGLTNVTSLMFAEDQVGFLAGVLAGGMSKSGFVCSISSLKTPGSDRYVISFRAGAVWQAGDNIRGMNNYINIQTTDSNVPTVNDSTNGKDTAQNLIDNGCDVVLAVAANGALLAAKQNNLPAVGADVDEYYADPEAQDALMTSALKNVDVAVYNYLKTVADGSVKAGINTATLQNGGVGLAPFHDWDSRISADLKAQIQQASDGIKNGSITVNLPAGG